MPDGNSTNRRTVLRLVGASGAIATTPVAAAKPTSKRRQTGSSEKRLRLDELAIEAALHPQRPVAAITTIGLGDGYQLYVVSGVESVSDTVHTERDLEQVSRADSGVHGVHWKTSTSLLYSEDGQTVERSVNFDEKGNTVRVTTENVTVVSDTPLPLRPSDGVRAQAVDIPYPIDCKSGGNVCCTDVPFVNDWCVRATTSDSGHSPECNGHNPPAMSHGHFAIFPEGDYRDGINIWIGHSGNCIWVGEEHNTKWCTRVCGPEGGAPSLSDLRDAYEKAINKAADAAGIAIPTIVVTAIAYYLAASTVAPPFGVPLV